MKWDYLEIRFLDRANAQTDHLKLNTYLYRKWIENVSTWNGIAIGIGCCDVLESELKEEEWERDRDEDHDGKS